jgi:hypothetical protein
VQEAGELLLEHLESLGRKRSTVGEYRSFLRVHLAPFFGKKALDKVTAQDVEAFIALKRREERRPRASSITWGCCTRSSATPSGAASQTGIR